MVGQRPRDPMCGHLDCPAAKCKLDVPVSGPVDEPSHSPNSTALRNGDSIGQLACCWTVSKTLLQEGEGWHFVYLGHLTRHQVFCGVGKIVVDRLCPVPTNAFD